jgi:hypothetical protein
MTGSVLNIVIKLIAVILAVFLWFNVVSQKQYEYDYTLAVADIELPPSLGLVTPLPDSMTVKVLAEGKKLLRDDWKSAGLRIKAGRLRRGHNTLDINTETVSLIRPEDVTLLEFPGQASLSVQLDRLDSALIPVASRVAVIPGDGYMIVAGQGGISPLSTQVIGPALVLQRIDSIYTEQKILDDIEESVRITMGLKKPDSLDIKTAHDSATVEVVVDEIDRRRFDNIPVLFNAGHNNRIIVDPDQISLEIEGPSSSLDSLKPGQIRVQVAPRKEMTDGLVSPQIILPVNFRAVAVIPDSIRILVSP